MNEAFHIVTFAWEEYFKLGMSSKYWWVP